MASSKTGKAASNAKANAKYGSKSAARSAAKRTPVQAPLPKATEGMSGAQRIVWFSLQALILLVPIAMSNANWIPTMFPGLPGAQTFILPLTYDQFDIVKVFVMRCFAIIGIAVWCFDTFVRGGKVRRTKLDWVILLFLGWVLFTSLPGISVSPATAIFGKYRRFEGFLSFLTYAITFFLVVQVADRPTRIRSLARTLLISSAIVAGYGVAQFFGIDAINWGAKLPFETNRAFSTFGNPDLLGGFIVFPLCIAPALALSERKLWLRAAYWAAWFLTVVCWWAAFVRGAWLGGLLGLAALAVAVFLARPTFGAVDGGFAGMTGLATAWIVYKSSQSGSAVLNVIERFKSITQFDQGSAKTRFEIWQAAIDAVKARPITGFGADTFRLVFPKYKPLAYTRDAGYLSVADNVHNYPLQLAAGIGVVGFLLLYGLFGFALWLGAPNAFSRGKGVERLVISGFWAAALAYIGALFTGLSVTGSTVFLWIALAMIVTPTAREVEVKVTSWSPAVGFATVALLAVAWGYNWVYIAADNYYLKGQFGQTMGVDSVQAVQTAIKLNPYNDMYRSQLGQAYQEQMLAWLNDGRTKSGQGQDATESMNNARAAFALSEQAYNEAIGFVPTEYDNYVFLASLYNQAGAYLDVAYFQKAIDTANKGIEVEPYGPAIRMQKAVSLWSQRKVDETIDVLLATVSQDPAYSEPRTLLIDALKAAGRLDEAADQYRIMLKYNPDNQPAKDALKAIEASLSGSGETTKQ